MALPDAAAGVLALPAQSRLISVMRPSAVPPDRSDDAELVARIRLGDTAAFEAVFRRYVLPLCAFAYRYVRSREVATEVVHDVLLRIWQHRDRLEIQENLNAYLYRAIRNRAVDVARHEEVGQRWVERAALEAADRYEEGDTAGSPMGGFGDDMSDAAANAAAVEQALDLLPERCRQVFLLRWRDDMSYANIAASMGTSIKTVENQMNRAIRTLRKALRP